jgi:hypothetical protein
LGVRRVPTGLFRVGCPAGCVCHVVAGRPGCRFLEASPQKGRSVGTKPTRTSLGMARPSVSAHAVYAVPDVCPNGRRARAPGAPFVQVRTPEEVPTVPPSQGVVQPNTPAKRLNGSRSAACGGAWPVVEALLAAKAKGQDQRPGAAPLSAVCSTSPARRMRSVAARCTIAGQCTGQNLPCTRQHATMIGLSHRDGARYDDDAPTMFRVTGG